MNKKKYFVNEDPEDVAGELLTRATNHFQQLDRNGYFDKIEQSWMSFHGMFFDEYTQSHRLTTTGEQGELLNLPVNHFRNIATNIITMITTTRPQMQTRATNTDAKSLIQAKLGNGILDFYMREKRLERFLTEAVKYAIVYGSGFVKMDWDVMAGQITDYEEDGSPIYTGDIVFKTVSPTDVFFDNTKESYTDHNWVLTRTFKNKYDIAEKYPEFREEILKQDTKSEMLNYRLEGNFYSDTDDIPIYEFYHKSTPSVPEGKYLLFIGDNSVLHVSGMPYRDLPVFRVTSGDILGTPLAYSPMFDLLPLQDALNILYSAVMTNNHTFGVQNIISPRGSDVEFTQIDGGMNFIEYNSEMGGKPEALQLTQSAPETYKLIEALERKMETISGVNSVARGNPEKHLSSGTALAMVQSMALQYISGLQQSYIQLIEDCGTNIINMLKDFAAEPRVASIVGKMNEIQVKRFSGDDLASVERVVVDVGNPITSTHAGKMQIADQLLQYQLLDDPKQYLTILRTGNLDTATDDFVREDIYMQDENEAMLNGDSVQAVVTDDHVRHINAHKFLLSDINLKQDPELVERVSAHLMEHIELLRNTDPGLLAAMGQQPIGPAGGTPNNPMDPNQEVNNGAGDGQIEEAMDPAAAMGDLPEAQGISEPNMPSPPPVNDPRQL